MFLGLKTIRQIAMTVGIYDMFVGKTDKESLRRRRWWRHSVDTAVCSRWLATKMGRISPEDAYTCGLLHYIGKTLLDRFGDQDYSLVESLVLSGKTDLEAEMEIYGCDHSEIALAAATKWGFPEPLLIGIQYNVPLSASEPHAVNRACVAIASRLAELTLAGGSESEPGDAIKLPEWSCDVLGISPDQFPDLMEGARVTIAEAATLQL
jgi:HD-like signal output (HDOD) protein